MYRPEADHLIYGAAWMLGAIVAGPCYVLIMHHLSGYLQFSIMVGIVVFALQYALYPHVHPIARIFTTIGFTIVIDAENQQHYSMQSYLQAVLWMATAIATTLAVRFAFFPRRPDVTFLKVLDQFFRHADFLLSAHDAEGKPDRSLTRRLRSIFYRHSLLEEAERLAIFAGQLDPKTGQTTYKMLRGATPEQVQELVRSVYALGHRINALVEAREAWQSNLVDKHLMHEKREWHQVMQEVVSAPSRCGTGCGARRRSAGAAGQVGNALDEAFARIGEGELSTEDYENFYQRLGNYRGLSEAAADFARIASRFDWPRWQETRF